MRRNPLLTVLFVSLGLLISACLIWLVALGPRTRYVEPRLGRGPCFMPGTKVTIRPGGWTYCAADIDALEIAYDVDAEEAARGLETSHVIGRLKNGDMARYVGNDGPGIAVIRIDSVRAVFGVDWLVGKQMLIPCDALVGVTP